MSTPYCMYSTVAYVDRLLMLNNNGRNKNDDDGDDDDDTHTPF